MRLILIALVICAGIIGPLSAQTFPEAEMKSRCAEDYPGDFFMQQGCLELNRDSFERFEGTVTGLPEDIGAAILAKCKKDYPGDYFMQTGCADLQADSWRQLNN